MKETDLKNLAKQLREPSGKKGHEIGEMMTVTNAAMINHCFENIAPSNKEIIAEIGHGNGSHIHHWLIANPSTTYVGIEKSALMYTEAQRNNAKWVNDKRAFFYLIEDFLLPLSNNSITAITTINTLYFWAQTQLMFQELVRILKSDGQLNITFADKSFMEQLPFTSEIFKLYDLTSFEKLVADSPFYIQDMQLGYDSVTNTNDEPVKRLFYTKSQL